MKELTIEEKAARYDETLAKAKRYYNEYKTRDNILYVEDMEDMFPELKESEDEELSKLLYKVVYYYINDPNIPYLKRDEVSKKIIPYIEKLEKQGEQKHTDKAEVEHLIPQKGMYYTCIKDYYSSDNTHLYVKGNIYKSFFNGYIEDESHFGLSWTNSCTEKYFKLTKDDDWIVCEHNNVIDKPIQYKEFKKKANQNYVDNLKAKGITPKLRLWTIEDANDGDILADEYNNIGIYKKEQDEFYWHSYTYLGYNNYLYCGNIGGYHEYKNTKPATKEQRDLLFKKVKEAGYEWDVEKKKLRKC